MQECNYCSEVFESEDTYHDHLASDHADELGPIDQRRVGAVEESDSALPISAGPLALVLVIGLSVGIIVYVVFGIGGSSDGPSAVGSVHEHGTLNMTVTGEQVDFSQGKYQQQDRAFHFEGGGGEVWHVHAQGVTLAYAMETLDIPITQDSVTFNGTTYRADDPEWNVIVQVNGEPVNPEEYVLQGTSVENAPQGDNIRIVVKRA